MHADPRLAGGAARRSQRRRMCDSGKPNPLKASGFPLPPTLRAGATLVSRERCESGRIGLTANEVTSARGSEGSNPSLSATGRQPGVALSGEPPLAPRNRFERGGYPGPGVRPPLGIPTRRGLGGRERLSRELVRRPRWRFACGRRRPAQLPQQGRDRRQDRGDQAGAGRSWTSPQREHPEPDGGAGRSASQPSRWPADELEHPPYRVVGVEDEAGDERPDEPDRRGGSRREPTLAVSGRSVGQEIEVVDDGVGGNSRRSQRRARRGSSPWGR